MAALNIKNLPRCRRRHQDRRILCQGYDQERDCHQRRLAEFRDVRRQRLRLPERRLRRDHGWRLLPGAAGTGGIVLTTAWASAVRSNTTGIHTGRPACSAATRPSGTTVAPTTICWLLEPLGQGAYGAAFAASYPSQALAGNAAGNYTCNPVFNVSQLGVVTRWTPVKNLTFSGEGAVVPSRPEDVGLLGVCADRPEADRALPVQGSGHRPASAPRPA